ncbi:MAG: hypothetical protein QG654_283 [Patescibacteria group bacterium]|nr:hypothetical protein [Patescibacteria group bacterium]
MKINNKILILGGTSGTCFQTAKRLSKDNQVIVVGQNENEGALISMMKNIKFVKCDIKDKKRISTLINNMRKYLTFEIVDCK